MFSLCSSVFSVSVTHTPRIEATQKLLPGCSCKLSPLLVKRLEGLELTGSTGSLLSTSPGQRLAPTGPLKGEAPQPS